MKKTLALGIACAALLAGCSGGDDGDGGAPPGGGPVVPGDNHTFATAATVPVPGTARSDLASGSDYDYYVITVPAGVTSLNVQTFDQGGTSCDLQNDGVDPYVEIFDASQGFLTASDDSGINWCEDFNVTVTPGATYYVAVSGYPPFPFTYVLSVRPN